MILAGAWRGEPQNKEATAWLQDTKEQQQLEAWYYQAQDSIEKENWKDAVGLLEKILRHKSAYRDAAEILKRVRRQVGLAALYKEAEQQMNSGNWVAASEALRQILAQVQGYREAENLLRYCTARASEVKEEWSEVVRLYDEILSAERSFHDVSTRLEEARRQARLQWLYSEAQTQEEVGQWTRAVEHYEQIYDITPTYRDVESRLQEGRQQRDLAETYQAGLRHMRRRRWNQAIETFRRVIEQTPDYRDAKLRLQESLTRREEQYSALRRFYYIGILSLATTVLIWIIFGAGANRILGALFDLNSPRTPPPSPSEIAGATATPTIMTDTPTLATESPPARSTPIPLAEAGSFLFSSTRKDNNAELYSMNADGSDQQRLTWHRARDQSPRRSPDGTKIVFVSDREDIEQELALHVWRQLPKSDPDRGSRHTFVARVIEKFAVDLIRSRYAAMRDFRKTAGSLDNEIEMPNGTRAAAGDMIDQDDYLAVTGRALPDLGLTLDFQRSLDRLPVEQRELCLKLMVDTVTEVAAALGKPRPTLYEDIKKLRKALEDAGLREYL